MTIYTIAMGAGAGADQIAKCATSKTGGIDDIFAAIAQRITALRLAL